MHKICNNWSLEQHDRSNIGSSRFSKATLFSSLLPFPFVFLCFFFLSFSTIVFLGNFIKSMLCPWSRTYGSNRPIVYATNKQIIRSFANCTSWQLPCGQYNVFLFKLNAWNNKYLLHVFMKRKHLDIIWLEYHEW